MNALYVPWLGALVYLLFAARMGFGVTLAGTVSQVGPAGQFVYQTGSPNGLVRVYYSPCMVTPKGSEIIRNQFVAVDGDFDQDSNFMASAVGVMVRGMPDALDYYVSPDGSDASDGSADHPWQTISHAASALTLGQFGTVVHVAAGTYAGEHGGAGVQITSSGTATARIRFVSDGQWQAQVSGKSYGIYTNASYVDIVGFDVSAPTGAAGIDMGPNPPIAGSGIGMYVFGNYVHDIGDGDPICHSGGGISSSSGDELALPQAQGIITGNVVNRVGNLALTACNQTHGIYVSNGWTVENNIVSNAVGYGLHFYAFGCNITATNNTVFSNGWGGVIVNGRTFPGCDGLTTISNNIIVNNGFNFGHPAILEYNGGSSSDVFMDNLIAGNSEDAIQIAGGTPAVAGNIFGGDVSSIFVNYSDDGSGDYHLAPGSPAIAAGASVPCVSGSSNCVPLIDFDGFERPQCSAYSIGAYECNGAGARSLGSWTLRAAGRHR